MGRVRGGSVWVASGNPNPNPKCSTFIAELGDFGDLENESARENSREQLRETRRVIERGILTVLDRRGGGAWRSSGADAVEAWRRSRKSTYAKATKEGNPSLLEEAKLRKLTLW